LSVGDEFGTELKNPLALIDSLVIFTGKIISPGQRGLDAGRDGIDLRSLLMAASASSPRFIANKA
jgi:hypothetical protein